MTIRSHRSPARRSSAVRPTSATYLLVYGRDLGCCARCGDLVWGQRGTDFSLHHRRGAKAGGDRRPESHLAGNLILLHGHGSAGCNWEVEVKERARSYTTGFLVREPYMPSAQPIDHKVHGFVLLDDQGGWTADEGVGYRLA